MTEEFTLITEDMEEEHEYKTVELPSHLPARVGKKAFRKLDKQVQDSGFNVNDPDTLLDAKDYLINEMFNKAGVNSSADELAMESYNEIGNFYWNKVVQAEKKRQG